MIDILVTTYNRLGFLRRTLDSLSERMKNTEYRLFVADDCSSDGTDRFLGEARYNNMAGVVLLKRRSGVSFAFNALFNLSEIHDEWDGGSQWVCYMQDDMVSEVDDWPLLLTEAHCEVSKSHPVGFVSGYDAPEHPVVSVVNLNGCSVVLKDSQPASNLMATREFWRSIGYVPRLNPDGSDRGFPSKGKGSHIDLYWTGCMSGSKFVRKAAAPNCSRNQGKMVLVVPGLLMHIGGRSIESTWRRTG